MQKRASASRSITITDLLRPRARILLLGFAGVLGEGVANLLAPWPLKIVLDNVLKSRASNGWLNQYILSRFDDNKIEILEFAALAVLIIAIVGGLCSYVEKFVTTTVGQWVTHDLRRA